MQQMLMTAIAIVVAALFSACAASEEKAGSAPVPAAAAAASPAENVAQTITQLEREWAEAGVKADAAALDRLMADDWITTGWEGLTLTKAQNIETFKQVHAGLYATQWLLATGGLSLLPHRTVVAAKSW
jgi:hypothetical protein